MSSPTEQKNLAEGQFSPTYVGYERPTSPYVCGRGATWGRPCASGPHPGGDCGGTTECTPFKKGDRWECRRPAANGGPCTEGPQPNGRCSHSHPPCVPRPSLRTYRGRIALLMAGAVIALIAAFLNFSSGQITSIDPGRLSHKHDNFVRKSNAPKDRGCESCHLAHNKPAVEWIKAIFQPADMTSQCTHCHRFGNVRDDEEGRRKAPEIARAAHNHDDPRYGGKPGVPPTQCQMCHTEHAGEMATLVKMGDQQCNACHAREKIVLPAPAAPGKVIFSLRIVGSPWGWQVAGCG
jgi:hypothetical protein